MLKDWRGNEIVIGSKIIWSTGGSYAYMKEGLIEKINLKPSKEDSNILVVKSLSVRCTDVSGTGYYRSDIGKVATITRFDRVVVMLED